MLRKQCELTMATTVRACRGEVLEGGRRSGVAVLHEIPAEPRLWRARGAGETAGVRIARKHSGKRRLEDPSLYEFLHSRGSGPSREGGLQRLKRNRAGLGRLNVLY